VINPQGIQLSPLFLLSLQAVMKPSIPRGTRDFGPAEMRKRQYILNIVRNNFELFGFQPIETPAMENIETLTGKYGDEGDQLIFKVLNSRIHESRNKDLLRKEFELSLGSSRNSAELTEKALRYDLTVPFARYVVMNQHHLTFPFKRYQIQAVWRADRPQKGRYREFYQCDADVIGSDSLVNEQELISLIDKSFFELKVPALIKFNNRKILTAISEMIGEPQKIVAITVAIDKLDKVGVDGVNKELTESGITREAIEKLQPLLNFKGGNSEKIKVLNQMVGASESGKKGIEEIEYLLKHTGSVHAELELDITLARGLTYYTGTIFEVKTAAGTFTPSILGGGRYDDLTGIFGLPNMSGVGISFGIDRIYDVMEELNLFPESISRISTTRLMFAHFDADTQSHCLKLASELRKNNIACEVYPDVTKKMGKQFDYANKRNIPFVCTVGSNEMQSGVYAVKNMEKGEQQQLSLEELVNLLKNNG
jgi:histidyl-tRNA synthetase